MVKIQSNKFFEKKNRVYQYGILAVALLLIVASITFGAPPSRQLSELTGNDYGTDTIYTMIRNSNGKYWAATSAGLLAAIADLPVGGEVKIPLGYISSSVNITVENDVTLIGVGSGGRGEGAVESGINFSSGACLIVSDGRVQNLRVNVVDGWTGDYAVIVEGDSYIWERHELLSNINIDNLAEGRTGTGLYFRVIGNDNAECIALCDFGSIGVRGFVNGIVMDSQDSTYGAYINGNNFERITVEDCTYGINITDSDGGETKYNTFASIEIQPNNNSVDGKTISGLYTNTDGNKYMSAMFWDWNSLATGYELHIDTGGDANYISANLASGYYLDNGNYNTLVDSNSAEYYINGLQIKTDSQDYDLNVNGTANFAGYTYFEDRIYINSSLWTGDQWQIKHNANDATDDYGLMMYYGSSLYAVLRNIAGQDHTVFNNGYEDVDFTIRGTDSDDTFKVNAGTNTVEITNLTVSGSFSGGAADGYAYDGTIQNSKGNSWAATGANIQAAIDDLTEGGTVYLPNGTITITSGVTLDNDISIVGAGLGATTIYSSSSITPITCNGKKNVTISEFTLDMNNAGSNGIYVTGGSDCVMIEDIKILNAGFQGIYLSTECNNVFITRVHVVHGNSEASHGFGLTRCNNTVISDCILENYYPGVTEDGVDIAADCTNITLNNIIIRGFYDGIKLIDCTYIDLNNIYIYDDDNHGIKIQGDYININNFHIIDEAGGSDTGDSLWADSSASHIHVSNGFIIDSDDVGMTISCSNFTAINVEIENPDGSGFVIGSGMKNVWLTNIKCFNAGSFNKINSGCSNIFMDNCNIAYGASYGISIDASSYKLTNSYIGYNGADGIDMTISACNNYSIIGCTFQYNDAPAPYIGIDCHASDDYNVITLNHFIGDALDDHSATKGVIENNIGDDI